jgi:hypothetical protein
MELVTWLTEDTTYIEDMFLAAQHAEVQLAITNSIDNIPKDTSLVLWLPNNYNEEDYQAIEIRCKRIIIGSLGSPVENTCSTFLLYRITKPHV